MTQELAADSADRGGSRGPLSRYLAILETFRGIDTNLSLSQIARRSDLPVSTAHRLVTQLCRERLLRRSASRTYMIGSRLVEIVEGRPSTLPSTENAPPGDPTAARRMDDRLLEIAIRAAGRSRLHGLH